MDLKRRVWEVVETDHDGDKWARAFEVAILCLIFLNITAVILETVDWLYDLSPTFFRSFEWLSVFIFTVEYVARVWSCTSDERYAHPIRGRLRFVARPLMMVDFLAIAPFYLASYGNLRVVRVLRLIRLFRVMKVVRYSAALRSLGRVVKIKRDVLARSHAAIAFASGVETRTDDG